MFGKLRGIFRKAEKEVEEKVEEKIEVLPEAAAEESEGKPEAPSSKPEEVKAEEVLDELDAPLEEETQEPAEEADKEELKEPEPVKAPDKRVSDERVEKKIRLGFRSKIKTTLGGKARLGESEIDDITWNLQMALMQSDVAMEVAEAINAELKQKLSSAEFRDPKGQVRQIFKDTLVGILEKGGKMDFMQAIKKHKKPVRVVFFGINGCGKTTTISKIAHMLKKEGLSVVLAAGDTFRAGAQEQLGKHAERLGVKMVHHQRGGDAAAVVFDAIKHAEANDIDVVLADTSGRMQSDVDLMGEMKKIIRVNKPDIKVFVGDALTGNDAVEQARKFNEEIGIDAAILAKFDASKGGAALSVSYITGKPIIFLGMGQGYDDLKPFDAKSFVDEIV